MQSISIGKKIANARKEINKSQAQIAEHLFISSQAVGKWERGESMPDISTLNRLAEILGVDLNYFSDSFSSNDKDTESSIPSKKDLDAIPVRQSNKKYAWNWNMSSGNWVDADFSGLKNLQDKFSSSNIANCKFLNSDLSGLILGKNNIEKCDFTNSDIRDSKIQSSNLSGNQFNNCSFIDAEFFKSNIGNCNFTEADFSGAEFKDTRFKSNNVEGALWKFTSFRNTLISDIIFEGTVEDCHFENCEFDGVKFQNATILNSFFKYNNKLKKVQFINCKVDNITYAFLKSGKADLTGLTLISLENS